MTDFPTHIYTSTSEIPTLSYTWSLKKIPLSGGASRVGHHREYPPPSPGGLKVWPPQLVMNRCHTHIERVAGWILVTLLLLVCEGITLTEIASNSKSIDLVFQMNGRKILGSEKNTHIFSKTLTKILLTPYTIAQFRCKEGRDYW